MDLCTCSYRNLWWPEDLEPGPGLAAGCEPVTQCACEELNSDLLGEQYVLLNAKPSLQASFSVY